MKLTTTAIKALVTGGLIIGLSACASQAPRPESQLQRAESSVQQAEATNARKYEPVLLNQARNKLADARNIMNSNDEPHYDQARRLLEQASVDAKLAGARSDTAKARQAVEEINQNIKKLQDELSNTQ